MPDWLLAASPWIVGSALAWWRSRWNAPPLEPAIVADELVSVIVPARNEARNIEGCVRSILGASWERIEVIVVNDHSSDATGEIARRLAAEDSRVTVIEPPPLPEGWFGKQWACHHGQLRATGRTLLFTDADTRHGPDILARAIASLRKRGAAMLTVMPSQDYGTFWERLMMPHVIALISLRFGDIEKLNRSTRPVDKIANGQFILMPREWYDRVGGHAAVRSNVGEDLRLAQEVTRVGGSMQILDGRGLIRTRMYVGLGELMRGWGKNIYAAGRDTIPVGPLGQAVLRLIVPVPPLVLSVIPFTILVLATPGSALSLWAVACYVAWAAWWIAVYVDHEVSGWYALLHPVAAFLLFVLAARAAWRGSRVEWKGREYLSEKVA